MSWVRAPDGPPLQLLKRPSGRFVMISLMRRLIILRGYPGSGKTTIGKRLEYQGLGTFIDHNRILTLITTITRNDVGIYEEISQLELAMTKKLINDDKSVIVARGFSSVLGIEPYVALARTISIPADVIRLNVEEDTLIARVQAPERKQDFNPTINEKTLRSWMRDNPLEKYTKEISINANQPLDDVIGQIVRRLSA